MTSCLSMQRSISCSSGASFQFIVPISRGIPISRSNRKGTWICFATNGATAIVGTSIMEFCHRRFSNELHRQNCFMTTSGHTSAVGARENCIKSLLDVFLQSGKMVSSVILALKHVGSEAICRLSDLLGDGTEGAADRMADSYLSFGVNLLR